MTGHSDDMTSDEDNETEQSQIDLSMMIILWTDDDNNINKDDDLEDELDEKNWLTINKSY